jgi:Fic family protein
MYRDETIDLMEPMLPSEGNRKLEDLVFSLIQATSSLKAILKPRMTETLGSLVRNMNCYYSNLIEGHNTTPRDIERALAEDFSNNPAKRDLQLEAKAHIEVQELIDFSENQDIVSIDFIQLLHREFCSRLPDNLLWIGEEANRKQVIAGEFRTGRVIVGEHTPPDADKIERFLERFIEIYHPNQLSKVKQVIAVASAHHRFLWIHPFYDGNGRVARLFSHAYFKEIGIGSSIWSVSRGLARKSQEYKKLLMAADNQRINDLDGRGNLSLKALNEFVYFFLETAIDQVNFMKSLLEPEMLLKRLNLYINEEVGLKKLPEGSFALLKEVILLDEVERGAAAQITGYQTRQARTVLNTLCKEGFLVSDTPKSAVRIAFPLKAIDRIFPSLYPSQACS